MAWGNLYRIIGLLLLSGSLSGCVGVQWSVGSRPMELKTRTAAGLSDTAIEAPDKRLPERQELTFNVQWLGISVGKIITSIKGIQNINGRDAYVLEATFQSNAFLSAIYKIEDRYVSYMDIEKLYTLRHEVYRRDGKYKKDAITEFDQDKHIAHFQNFIDNSRKDFAIPENVHDTLSAFYYLMLVPLKLQDKIELPVCNNEANYQLLGMVESLRMTKTPGAGEKKAFLIQPYAKLKGEKVQKGNLKAYFSCDKRRLPLLAALQGPVFTEVTVVLTAVNYPTEPQASPNKF
jgi:hypothetical protein